MRISPKPLQGLFSLGGFWLVLGLLLGLHWFLASTTPVIDTHILPLVLGAFMLPSWLIGSAIRRPGFRAILATAVVVASGYAWYVVKSTEPPSADTGWAFLWIPIVGLPSSVVMLAFDRGLHDGSGEAAGDARSKPIDPLFDDGKSRRRQHQR